MLTSALRKALVIATASVLILSTISATTQVSAYSATNSTPYRLHAPIFINSNAEFIFVNGIVSGTGTATTPYLIEGWEIQDSITIRNTNAYFMIRNVLIHPNNLETAIIFDNVANGAVENAILTAARFGMAIGISDSSNIALTGITASNSGGIRVSHSTGVTISRNNFTRAAIFLSASNQIAVSQNNFTGDGINLYSNSISDFHTTSITSDNLVNGAPLYYYKDCEDLSIDGISAGQVIVTNCNRVRVSNLHITGTSLAIEMAFVDSSTINQNTLTDNSVGLELLNATRTKILNNDFLNDSRGVYLNGANNTISANNFEQNDEGIVFHGTNETLSNNNISRCSDGVVLGGFNSTISGNTIYANRNGIHVDDSSADPVGNTWPSNTIRGNTVSVNQKAGIFIEHATDQVITGNNISNNGIGVSLDPQSTSKILVKQNNFVSNLAQSDGTTSSPFLDGGYPNGGNFWSNYNEVDHCSGPLQNICTGSDGIGDTPFTVNRALILDNYPHMASFGSPDHTLPYWIFGSSIAGYSVTTTSLSLEWTVAWQGGTGALDDIGVIHYRVYQDGKATGTVNATVNSASITGLSPATQYTFKVKAGDLGDNWSNDGPSLTITTPAQAPGPSTGPSPPQSPGSSTPQNGSAPSPWQNPYLIGAVIAAGLAFTGLAFWRIRKPQSRGEKYPHQSPQEKNLPLAPLTLGSSGPLASAWLPKA